MLRALAPLGVSVLVVDDNSPDGTGEIADRLAGELDFVSVLHRPEKQGLGPAYLAGFRRALADGADYVLEMDCDFSHEPGRRAAADRRLRGRRRSRTRLALRPGRRHGELGPDATAHLRRRLALRARAARRAVPRPHRRLQVLPPRGARAHRPRRDPLEGLRLPDRDDVPDRARRLQRRRGADHLRRPHGGRVEDEPDDLPRSGEEGAGAAARRAEGRSSDARARRSDLRRRDRGGDRSSSTSGRRGASRAMRSSRILDELARAHAAASRS